MLTTLSSVAVITLDILLLLLKVVFGVFESVYQTFVPPQEKSVANETVLVSYIM